MTDHPQSKHIPFRVVLGDLPMPSFGQAGKIELIMSQSDSNNTAVLLKNGSVPIGFGASQRRPGDRRDPWLGEQLALIRCLRDALDSATRSLVDSRPEYVDAIGLTEEQIKEYQRDNKEFHAREAAAQMADVVEQLRRIGMPVMSTDEVLEEMRRSGAD